MRGEFETLRENSRHRHKKIRDSAPRSKISRKRDFETYHKRFRDFEPGQTFPRAPFTKNHSILLTQKLGRKIRDAFSFLFDPMDWLLPGIKPSQAMLSFNQTRNFPGGLLPYISYIGMCRPIGQGILRRFGLKRGIQFAKFGLESGMVFEGNYESA